MKISIGTLGTQAIPVIDLRPENEAERDQLKRVIKDCESMQILITTQQKVKDREEIDFVRFGIAEL